MTVSGANSSVSATDERNSFSGKTLRELDEVPIGRLKRLTPKKLEALESWGVETVLDLLTTFPRRHVDRSRRVDVADLSIGDQAVVMATVRRSSLKRSRDQKVRVEVDVFDPSGDLRIVFFNQAWRTKQLRRGAEALFWGKITEFANVRQMVNPVVDLLVGGDDDAISARRTMRVIPIYPASAKAGLTSWEIGIWVDEALRRAGEFADPLPLDIRERLELPTRTDAMWGYHAPASVEEIDPARRRLAFDELVRLQLALALKKRSFSDGVVAIHHDVSPLDVVSTKSPGKPSMRPLVRNASRSRDRDHDVSLIRSFLTSLPFELTGSQRRCLAVIFADLAGPFPMHRLLQGDVGSGKTVVALATLLASVQGGHQGALMVPTEVLAEQHFVVIQKLTHGLKVDDPRALGNEREVAVAILTSRSPGAERRRVHDRLRSGAVDIVVGTHALLSDEVEFASLGVVVIDEQHRFGVEQRATLRDKGGVVRSRSGPLRRQPDLLVMTATPIPRTAAMVVFGDLDMTVLDELPPGRSATTTVWARSPLEAAAAWKKLVDEVSAGNQGYVVCPLVEDSEKVEARSAVEEYERLSRHELGGLRLGLIHAQMPAAEKDAVMTAFRNAEVQVLVATTVIEVGVDVPGATVMVIQDAGRFGIAQLHQLRGRVGRGASPGWCYLIDEFADQDAAARLAAVEASTDGFVLAEKDLEIRGEGTILGARQKGRSDLRVASLRRDRELLEVAREFAGDLVEKDPELRSNPTLRDEIELMNGNDEGFLFKS